ncbi:MAG: hypothetical protein AAF357_16905 [Verrucomicrobiota bacterium]
MSDTPPPLQPESPQYAAPNQGGSAPSGSSGKKWGIGCGIGCLVVLVVGAVLAIVGFNLLKKAAVSFVESNTSDVPVELLAPEVSQPVIESAIKRFDDFCASLEGGEITGPLVLTDEDINALIANHPDFSAVSEAMVVSIDGDSLSSEVSVSLDDLNLPPSFLTESIAGKYFNGEVTLSLGMVGGNPAMFIEALSLGGNPIPSQFMTELSKENILKEAQSDPEMQKFFDKIEAMEVKEGKLTIVPSGGQ